MVFDGSVCGVYQCINLTNVHSRGKMSENDDWKKVDKDAIFLEDLIEYDHLGHFSTF